MDNRTVFYEYYGLPGSGKTTLLRKPHSCESYYVNGVPINGITENAFNDNKLVRIIKGKPISLYLKSLQLMRKYNLSKSVIGFIRVAQVLSINMYNWVSKDIDAVVLNDNGYIQIVVSILKRQDIVDVDNFIYDFFKLFYSCHFVYHFVYVTASPEACYKRILARGKKLSITEGKVDTLKELYREKELFEYVTDRLIQYFRNDSNVSIESEENE